MRKLGIVLVVVAAIAAIPLVALAWQGPDQGQAPPAAESLELNAAATSSPQAETLYPAAPAYGPAGCPMWADADEGGLPDGYPWPADGDAVEPGYGPAGCPMWADADEDGLPDGYPWPADGDAVEPGYGPAGCPMWGSDYPDPGSGHPHQSGGHMWGHGMMHGDW